MEEWMAYALMHILAAAVGALVFVLVWLPMQKLLSANSRLRQAKPFFVRTLLIVMVLGALAPVVGNTLSIDEDTAGMEIVWKTAGKLGDSLLAVGLYLFGFVVVMTILAATLGKYSDE